MSVIAACSLFDGVLLAADCRVTIQRAGNKAIYLDCAQKLFPLTPDTALGFVGSVPSASFLLRELYRQLYQRRRVDAVSLSAWLPRFFRTAYARIPTNHPSSSIAFIVASILKGRPNIIKRDDAVAIMNRIGFGEPVFKRNFVPDILVRVLQTDPKYPLIRIPGTSAGLVYALKSPGFQPEPIWPLQYSAIGSGEGAFETITQYHDMIFASEPGNAFIGSTFMREAIYQFLHESKNQTVGGLYPMLKISGKGIEMLGFSVEIPFGGTKIKWSFDRKKRRWLQRNVTVGKEVPLLLPWEIPRRVTKDSMFNDFLDAYRQFRGDS